MKRLYLTSTAMFEFNNNSSNILQELIKKGYQYATIKEQIDKARIEDIICLLFFLSRFSFTNIHDSRDSKGKGRLSL